MKLFLELKLVDEHHRCHGIVRLEVSEDAAYMGQRVVDEIKAGVYFDPSKPSPLEAVVSVMRVRELRRDLLATAATSAGYRLADFLQDREGWHGADRAEKRDEIAKAASLS